MGKTKRNEYPVSDYLFNCTPLPRINLCFCCKSSTLRKQISGRFMQMNLHINQQKRSRTHCYHIYYSIVPLNHSYQTPLPSQPTPHSPHPIPFNSSLDRASNFLLVLRQGPQATARSLCTPVFTCPLQRKPLQYR